MLNDLFINTDKPHFTYNALLKVLVCILTWYDYNHDNAHELPIVSACTIEKYISLAVDML